MQESATDTERLWLALRTKVTREFRTRGGALVMLEITDERASFGVLCTSLTEIPGLAFPDFKTPCRYTGPARFRLKGQDYQVSIAHGDYRIRAMTPEESAAVSEELIGHVKRRFKAGRR